MQEKKHWNSLDNMKKYPVNSSKVSKALSQVDLKTCTPNPETIFDAFSYCPYDGRYGDLHTYCLRSFR